MRPRTGAGKLDCHAALVWAWTEDGQGRRTDLGDKSPKLSISGFAALNIRGLSSRNAVRKYRAAWQWWSAYPPEPGPTGKPDHKTGEGG